MLGKEPERGVGSRQRRVSVACWGDDTWGQIGVAGSPICQPGTKIHPPLPCNTSAITVPGLGGTASIALGKWHSCALAADGTAVCWGYNGQGELGAGIGSMLPPTAAPW